MHRLLQLTPQRLRAADLALRLVLAAVLFYASADKLLHPKDFAAAVKAYHILPDVLVTVTAVWLPWLELALGLSLVSGVWSEGAAVLTTGLFAAFWLALIVNYFRGIDVDCGCFSSAPASNTAEAAPMLWYIGRDAVLLGLALLTTWVRLRVAGEKTAE